MRRHCHQALAVIAMCVAAAATANAIAAGGGGLSISPGVLETDAKAGPVGSITVANTTAKAMLMTVRARPWLQPRSGIAVPDTRRTLAGQVSVSPSSFTLPAGQSRALDLSLLREPSGGSLYGNLEVIGQPQGAPVANAVRTRYRLIASVRLNPSPARRVLKVQVGRIRATRKTALVTLRNAGNTVTPIAGSARIVGGTGTVRTTIAEAHVLPDTTIDVSLRTGKLLPGRYVATIKLRQGTAIVANVKRGYTVR